MDGAGDCGGDRGGFHLLGDEPVERAGTAAGTGGERRTGNGRADGFDGAGGERRHGSLIFRERGGGAAVSPNATPGAVSDSCDRACLSGGEADTRGAGAAAVLLLLLQDSGPPRVAGLLRRPARFFLFGLR